MVSEQTPTNDAPQAPKAPRKRWYIVNTYTGSENVARASLIEEQIRRERPDIDEVIVHTEP